MITMKEIETEKELKEVLELCYDILGTNNEELYGYDAWHKRFIEGSQPLVYAMKDEEIVSAILGRAENKESLVIGFTACRENYRRQGITKRLLCAYRVIFQVYGQNVFQKIL